MNLSLFDRFRGSGYLLIMAFVFLFIGSSKPERKFKMVTACYFGAFEVFLHGESGLDRVTSVIDQLFNQVEAGNSGPNRSLKEFEGGETP